MKGAFEGFPHSPFVDEVTPLSPAKHALWYVLLSHPGFEKYIIWSELLCCGIRSAINSTHHKRGNRRKGMSLTLHLWDREKCRHRCLQGLAHTCQHNGPKQLLVHGTQKQKRLVAGAGGTCWKSIWW